MFAKLGELPNASVLVQATVLGTSVVLSTLGCAHQQQHLAPTCGPCCHGDAASCHPQEEPPPETEAADDPLEQPPAEPPTDAEPQPGE